MGDPADCPRGERLELVVGSFEVASSEKWTLICAIFPRDE